MVKVAVEWVRESPADAPEVVGSSFQFHYMVD